MTAKMVIEKKKDARALGSAEIREFIEGFTAGVIPDYQMSALAMAICCNGMTDRETADLTDAMMRSGRCLKWDGCPCPTADKHSTGGVGDKLSFIVQPVAAACGLAVPSLVGRSLGFTGGTADKLEAIPGYNASLTIEQFQKTVAQCGLSMSEQTSEITPADKKLYALRDVTGTVASIPLIVSSILSKKLAEGASTLVFDVKCGAGAFMKTREDAVELAGRLVSGARSAGRKAAALVTDMNTPLGAAVGNANEVAEALEILRNGKAYLQRGDVALAIELASLMVSLAKEIPLDEARRQCGESLCNGAALRKFEEMVAAHGGDISRFQEVLRKPRSRFRVQAMRCGYVTAIDAQAVARAAFRLGAGRKEAGDAVDPLAGVTISAFVGTKVALGSPLFLLEKSGGPDGLESVAADLLKAFTISPVPVENNALILERIL